MEFLNSWKTIEVASTKLENLSLATKIKVKRYITKSLTLICLRQRGPRVHPIDHKIETQQRSSPTNTSRCNIKDLVHIYSSALEGTGEGVRESVLRRGETLLGGGERSLSSSPTGLLLLEGVRRGDRLPRGRLL